MGWSQYETGMLELHGMLEGPQHSQPGVMT